MKGRYLGAILGILYSVILAFSDNLIPDKRGDDLFFFIVILTVIAVFGAALGWLLERVQK